MKKIKKSVLPSEILNTLFVLSAGLPLKTKLRLKTDKSGYKKVKPPFVMVINHGSTDDVKIAASVMYPQPVNFVLNVSDRAARNSSIMDLMGTVPLKHSFTDNETLSAIKEVVAQNGVIAIFPEKKVSVDGTNNPIDISAAQLIKTLKLPVVHLQINGAYLNKPCFVKTARGAQASATLKNLFSVDDIKYLSEEELFVALTDALSYDEYGYQREHRIQLSTKNTAAGLSGILYKCPACGKEFTLSSVKDTIKCSSCNTSWIVGRFGVITSENRAVNINSVPQWYFGQRKHMRNEISDNSYKLTGSCQLYTLHGKNSFGHAGHGEFTHDNKSFVYTGSMNGKSVRLTFRNEEQFNVGFLPADYVEFTADDCIYRFKPENHFHSAKINLAIEEDIALTNATAAYSDDK